MTTSVPQSMQNEKQENTSKLNSWILEVKEDSNTGDSILEFPPEVLEQTGWQEGDTINWIDNGDGSWTLTKKI
jgi:hypothetical protein